MRTVAAGARALGLTCGRRREIGLDLRNMGAGKVLVMTDPTVRPPRDALVRAGPR
jgi:hypothetical protein